MKQLQTTFYYSVLLLSILNLAGCEKTSSQGYAVGDKFPLSVLLKLINSSNQPVDIKNKYLLINFWASWCTPCRKEMPDLQQLSQALNKNHMLVIGVSIDEDNNLMEEFLLQQHIGFNNYLDPQQQLADKILAIQSYPETFILSPSGIILQRITGIRAWNDEAMRISIMSLYQNDIAGMLIQDKK